MSDKAEVPPPLESLTPEKEKKEEDIQTPEVQKTLNDLCESSVDEFDNMIKKHEIQQEKERRRRRAKKKL